MLNDLTLFSKIYGEIVGGFSHIELGPQGILRTFQVPTGIGLPAGTRNKLWFQKFKTSKSITWEHRLELNSQWKICTEDWSFKNIKLDLCTGMGYNYSKSLDYGR